MNSYAKNTNGDNMICQIGVVVIPRDIDREAYINTFYSTGKLFIVMEGGEAYKNVEVAKHLIDHIVFPESKLDKGSPLLLLSPEKYPESLIAVAVLSYPNELSGSLREGAIENQKWYYGNTAGSAFDAKNPSYQVFVNSKKDDEGNISLLLKTPSTSVVIQLDSKGDLSIASSHDCNTFAQNKITQKVFNNDNGVLSEIIITEENITISKYKGGDVSSQILLNDKIAKFEAKGFEVEVNSETKEVSVGKTDTNKDSAVLGTKNNEILTELIDTISNMQIITAVGTGVIDPASKALFEVIKNKLKTSLSKYAKIN